MATPIFCCGFECGFATGSTAPHVQFGGTTVPTFSTSTVRSGARSLRLSTSASSCTATVQNLSSNTRWVGRFYVYIVSVGGGSEALLCSVGGAGLGPNVYLNSSLQIQARVGLTTGTASGVLNTGQWYGVDFDATISAGGNDTMDVRVDGTALGQATAAGLGAGSSLLFFGSSDAFTAEVFIDDFILSNTGADYPVGAGYVNHFVPTADGAHNVATTNDFERTLTGTDIDNATTTAFQLVDDVPLDTGTPTDFINLIAPGSTDYVEVVFGPAPGISTPTVAPRAVEVITVSAALSTTTNNLRLALNDNGTLDDVRNATVGSTTCIYNRKHYAAGPAGAWVIGGGGGGDFTDLRMRCFTSDANPDPYWVGAMIEAEFEVTESPSVSPSASASPSASTSPSASKSPSASESPSISPSASVSPSSSSSASKSPSASTSPSASVSPSASESPSTSPSASESPSKSPSASASPSASTSPSASVSLSKSPSASDSPSAAPDEEEDFFLMF